MNAMREVLSFISYFLNKNHFLCGLYDLPSLLELMCAHTLTLLQGRWNLTTGECEDFKGKGHSNQIMDIAVIDNTIISIGMDDMAMFTPEQSDTMG